MKLGALAFRNIRRNRRRSILSGSAIAVATMTITLMFGWVAGILGDDERLVSALNWEELQSLLHE